jgi:hypothetical protein
VISVTYLSQIITDAVTTDITFTLKQKAASSSERAEIFTILTNFYTQKTAMNTAHHENLVSYDSLLFALVLKHTF